MLYYNDPLPEGTEHKCEFEVVRDGKITTCGEKAIIEIATRTGKKHKYFLCEKHFTYVKSTNRVVKRPEY
jgi:hypothetical protein